MPDNHLFRQVLEVQEKYEREVMLHGTNLQSLAKIKEKLASHTEEMEKLQKEKIAAEETLAG